MRPEERRQTRRTLQPTNQPTVQTEVNARPVTTHVSPGVKPNRLLQALKAVNPALNAYADKQSEEDLYRGRQAALDEVSIDEAAGKVKSGEWLREQNPHFQRGYMNYYGQRVARESVRDLSGKFENEFNPDTGDIDQFLEQYTAEDLAGNQDGDFLQGYTPVMNAAKAKIRDQFFIYQTEKVSGEVDDGIYQNLEAALQVSIQEGGTTITPSDFAALKADAVDFFGKTPKEFEELAFSAINKFGMEGNPEAFDIFFDKRQDGSPGLAHTKKMGEKIKQAQLRATSVAVTKMRAKAKAEADAEKKVQASIESKVMSYIMEGNDATDMLAIFQPNMKQSTVRSLSAFQEAYAKSSSNVIQDPGIFGDMLNLVVQGNLDPQDLNAVFKHSVSSGKGLTPQDYMSLVNMNERLDSNKARVVGNSGAIAANKRFLLGQYKINSNLLLPTESSQIEAQRAAAQLYYDQATARYIHNNKDINQTDTETHSAFLKFAKEAIEAHPPPEDIFKKFGSDAPSQYQGKGGRGRLADDYESGKISVDLYQEIYPKTSP